MKVASAIAALVGAGAIARAKSQEGQVVRMVFLDTPKDKAMAIPYSKLLTVMESYGVPSHQGGYEIHPDVLVSKTERSMATVRKWLKDLGDAGCVRAATPYRGAETAIAGPLSLVDFTRLERKRTQAFRKLKDVETYLTTPDKDKHTYLENYFQHDVD
jgi:hypothetical protein